MRRKIGGMLLTVTGILACPCHLVVTLPLLLALFGGTALGSFLTHHTVFVYGGTTLYFVVALVLGMRFLLGPNRAHTEGEHTCVTCEPINKAPGGQEPSASLSDCSAGRR